MKKDFKKFIYISLPIFVIIVISLVFLNKQDKTEPETKKEETLSADYSPETKEKKEETAEQSNQPCNDEKQIPGEPASPEINENNEDESGEEVEKGEKPIIDDGTPGKCVGTCEGTILPYKGFEESLLAMGLTLPQVMEINNVIRFSVDLRFLVAGEKLIIKTNEDGSKVTEFYYIPNIITRHILKRDSEDKLVYSKEILPSKKVRRIITGEIESTLNQALIERDDVTAQIRNVVNGVLECIVNFRMDARKGDKYTVLVEEKFYQGEKVPGAKILYASYEGVRAKFHEAFFYHDKDPASAFNAHYSEEGKALIRDALRLPLDVIHVTSPFGYRRHPVTGLKKFHNGVDFGGPVGTPVYAVAKGVVTDVKTTPYGGKQITIKHADGTQTYYLHLNKFLVKRGAAVMPRERIALVGRTGRVTGPHLHFGIKSPQGKWLNPLLKRMIATPKLDNKRMERFKTQIADIKKSLTETEKYQYINNFVGPLPEEECHLIDEAIEFDNKE